MRILVLKHRRAGGFALFQWIASELQLHHYHEPLGEEHPFNKHNAERALNGSNGFQVTYEDVFETKKDIDRLVNYLEISNLRYLDTLNIIDPAAKKLRKVINRKLI